MTASTLATRIKLALGAIASTGLALLPLSPAQAFTPDGSWNYVRDSFNDSTYTESGSPITVGGTLFELYGLAIKQEGDTISVAFNTNLGLGGHATTLAADGNIGWGDLIFNFGDTQYGVRFAATNDSQVSELGLYENITTADVTAANYGWPTIQQYENKVVSHLAAGESLYGDLGAGTTELGDRTTAGKLPTVIGSGTKVANDNFQLLDAATLTDLDFATGLNANGATLGSKTIAFSFTRSAAMVGNFTATLFAECFNDGVALKGTLDDSSQDVPESSGWVTLTLLAVGIVGFRQRPSHRA